MGVAPDGLLLHCLSRNPKTYPHPRLQDFPRWMKAQTNTGKQRVALRQELVVAADGLLCVVCPFDESMLNQCRTVSYHNFDPRGASRQGRFLAPLSIRTFNIGMCRDTLSGGPSQTNDKTQLYINKTKIRP